MHQMGMKAQWVKPCSRMKREWLNRFKIFDYKHAYRLVFE